MTQAGRERDGDRDDAVRFLEDDKDIVLENKDEVIDDPQDEKNDKDKTSTPTTIPTSSPTQRPTSRPTSRPTGSPSSRPTRRPTRMPTSNPTASPTDLPTVSPTLLPTTSPSYKPTGAPTLTPTSMPTSKPSITRSSAPTTLDTVQPSTEPTGLPTSTPTTEYSAAVVGDMALRVSIFNEDVDPAEADVVLSKGLIESFQEVLCETGDFELYESISTTDVDICTQARRRTASLQDANARRHLGEIAGDRSAILKTPFAVVDPGQTSASIRYTAWTLRYPVVDVDQEHIQDGDKTRKDEALLRLTTSTQFTLDKYIKSGELEKSLKTRYPGTQLSIPGNEADVFVKNTTVTENDDGYDDEYYTNDLESNVPPNALRFAGAALLVMSAMALFCLCRLAKKRRRIRLEDAEQKEEMEGGLVTTEGVEKILASAHMIQKAKRSTVVRDGGMNVMRVGEPQQQQFQDTEDDGPNFALPSSYAVGPR